MDVTAVLTNYRRPKNLPEIIKALHRQTKPPKRIIVVDNSPTEPAMPLSVVRASLGVDDWIRISNRDLGPCCRFVAIPAIDTPLTLFLDDDAAPAPDGIASMLDTANLLRGEFATIGEVGRRIDRAGEDWKLVRANVDRSAEAPVDVDVTCRGHLVRTSNLGWAVAAMTTAAGFGADAEELRHDDIFLSLGIHQRSGFYSWLAQGTSRKLLARELPYDHANNRREGHNASRNRLVNRLRRIGW